MTIKQALENFENKLQPGVVFSPSKEFYNEIGINQKRFGQLLREETEPTIKELRTMAEYFGVPLNELINAPQAPVSHSLGLTK